MHASLALHRFNLLFWMNVDSNIECVVSIYLVNVKDRHVRSNHYLQHYRLVPPVRLLQPWILTFCSKCASS